MDILVTLKPPLLSAAEFVTGFIVVSTSENPLSELVPLKLPAPELVGDTFVGNVDDGVEVVAFEDVVGVVGVEFKLGKLDGEVIAEVFLGVVLLVCATDTSEDTMASTIK